MNVGRHNWRCEKGSHSWGEEKGKTKSITVISVKNAISLPKNSHYLGGGGKTDSDSYWGNEKKGTG